MTDKTMGADAFSLENSASHLLHRAQQAAASRSAEALKAAGITLRQFSVLAAVSRDQGVSQSQLVGMTGIDRSTLADMAARMEEAKLIKRVASPTDARAKSITLLAAGRRALEKAMPGVAEADQAMLEALPKTRRDSFLKALAELSDAPVAGDADEDEAAPEPAPAPEPKPAKAKAAKAKPAKPKPAKAAKPKAAKAKPEPAAPPADDKPKKKKKAAKKAKKKKSA